MAKAQRKKSIDDDISSKMNDDIDRQMKNMNGKSNGHATEPLSNFQDLSKTKRVDPLYPEGTDQPANEAAIAKVNYDIAEISKVKVRDEHFMHVEFLEIFENDKTRNPTKSDKNWPVHDDWKASLQAFRIHLAALCKYINPKKIKGNIEDYKFDDIDEFEVLQVSLNANQDGLTISGKRKGFRNKWFALNTPDTKFEDGKDDAYDHGESMQACWEVFLMETQAYLSGEKRGILKQLSLDLPEQGQDDHSYAQTDL